MSTTSSAPPSAGSGRMSLERVLVWGGILILVAVAGFEIYAKRSFEQGLDTLQTKLMEGDKIGAKPNSLTNFEVKKLLGKEPEFQGNPGQIESSSDYYEAYVWRSLLKRKFTRPPEQPEKVDTFAIYSGEVHPDHIKYRKPEEPASEGFFAAYVVYVYYGSLDPVTQSREVVDIALERKKYTDQVRPIPSREELERRHKMNMGEMFGNLQKGRPPLTEEEKEALDTWKHPLKRTEENMKSVPAIGSGHSKGEAPQFAPKKEAELGTTPVVKETPAAKDVPAKKDGNVKKSAETKAEGE